MIKKTFRELYNEKRREKRKAPTPAQLFISEVAQLTDRSEVTVKMWLYGSQVPDPNVSKVIGMHYGIDPASLFARN